MAPPNINVDFQPTHNGKAYYLPIAAQSAGKPELVKLVLRLRITNNELRPITLTGITFSFPGTDITIQMKGEKIAMDPAGEADPNDGVIAPGTTAVWSNGVVDLDTSEEGVNKVRNEVYLNAPAPAKVKVSLTFARSDPFTKTMELIPYTNPTGDGAFIHPFSAADLDHGEYIVTSAQHWANGGAGGTQIFAHDIGVQARAGGEWTSLVAGGKKTRNEDYRVWGKPVRALAAGTVLSFENDFDDNPVPGEKLSPDANHVWVRHGNVKVLYTHFQKGSIPAELRDQPDAPVTAGQILGLAGNSGRSDAPHLHLECRDFATNSLRGIPFKRGWVLDRELVGSNGTGPWVRLTSDGISKEAVAIWPSLFPPLPPPDLPELSDKLFGQVFGGVSKGGDGFVIVGGKILRVPPRGPKWALLESLIALTAAEQLRGPSADRMKRQVTETIRDIVNNLDQEF